MRRIVVHIDRLVLRGVEPAQAEAVSQGLRNEMRSLLGGAGALDVLSGYDKAHAVRCQAVNLPPNASISTIGRIVASRILRQSDRSESTG